MKLRTKLFSTILMFCLTIVTLMVGVWAVKSASVSMGGTLSFIAPGVEATISNGTLTNGIWQNSADASTKLQEVQITKTDTETTLATKFASWQDINLNFQETGDDITITFTITNNSSSNAIDISVSTSYTSATNCTIAINTSSVSLDAGASQSFTLTMKISDKELNASMTNFAVVFNMQLDQPSPPVDTDEVSYLTFSYDDTYDTAQLTACSASAPDVVEIPERVINNDKTYEVTSIAPGTWDYDEWIGYGIFSGGKEIIIPDTVTDIGGYAFCSGSFDKVTIGTGLQNAAGAFDYANVTNLIFKNGIKKIPSWFSTEANFTNVTIPNTVVEIERDAFRWNYTLTSITIPDSVISIGDYAFASCTKLESVTIGSGVTSIDDHAFSGCTGLTSITIPDSVISIGDYAFAGCTKFESVTIGSGVTSIGGSAFSGCTGLTTITIPDGVTSIGMRAFEGCDILTYNTYGNAKYLGNSTNKYVALMSASSKSITLCIINSSCKVIADIAFSGCSLTAITIPASVTSITGNPFQSCSGLETIVVESGNTVYNSNNNCNAIIETSTSTLITGCKNTAIPSTVTSIGTSAFYGCTGLTTITIPDSVTSIGTSAFNGCTKLAKVEVKATTVPTGGSSMFLNCPLTTGIFVPSARVNAYKAASEWSSYSSKIYAGNF